MRILIIGGTVFLGRALVDSALAAEHEVTLFNRGKSAPDAYPEIETIIGDRDGGLEPLKGHTWDAVIDTCGYFPRIVRQSAELLADAAERYVFISSLSAYGDVSKTGINEENGTLATMEDETVEEITGETYGPLKVLCEQAAADAFGPERTLIIRPGLIVGAYDRSDRFTYWPVRIAEGGRVLVPETADKVVQFTDVKDLADFTIHLLEQDAAGDYNVTGAPEPTTMGDVVEACQAVSGSDAEFVWVDGQFLLEHKVGPWMELPLWIPASDAESAGFFGFDCSKAFAAGLKFRPLAETVQDTLAWANSRPEDYTWRAGMKREREQELLSLWADGKNGAA